MLLLTDGQTIDARDQYIAPFKLVCAYRELAIDVLGDDFLTFMEFLPYFVNSDNAYNKLPK